MYNLNMAKSNSYFIERSKDCTKKTREILKEMPDFMYDYFVGIENNTSELTRLNYAYDLRTFFTFLLEETGLFRDKSSIFDISPTDLNRVKSTHIERYLSYVSNYETKDGKTMSNAERGKARKLASVRSLFKYLFRHNMLEADVASKVPTPKLHTKEIVRLEKDEVSRLLDAVQQPSTFSERQKNYNKNTFERDNAIVTLFLGTGIRISELVGLNVEDFDFSQGAFKVTRKGGNQAILYFSKEVESALYKWLEKRQTLPIDESERAMFISLQNKRICVRAVEKLVQKFAKESTPLKKISPHKLRSTFGTNLYRETGDIYIVADVLGHKDVNTTKRHYAAINEDRRRSVAHVINLTKK